MSLTSNIARAKTDYDEVYEAGKQAQYDEFWDAFQQNGNRTDYKYGFAGKGWSAKTFYPKYDMTVSNTLGMFQEFGSSETSPLNLRERLEECGVRIFIATTGQMGNTFYAAYITEIPELDLSAISSLNGTFGNCSSLQTVSFRLSDDGRAYAQSSAFTGCNRLVNLTITGGVLAKSGLDLSWSKELSKASIQNIVEHLSTTSSGQSVTFSLTAVNNAFETSSGAANGSTSTEWANLIATRSNWTINLLDS